ncbi:hypothetical protein ACFL6U_32700 [Planctomycetota bacterium]
MYEKQVDKRSRKAMTAFLKNHYKYHTMNSWNQSTSFANCIKLHHVNRPETIDSETWWQMMDISDWHDRLKDLLDDFGNNHEWTWQASINGRSGGYVVLYRGGTKPSRYKSYCNQCGQKNFQAVPEGQIGICGRCGAQSRTNFKQTHMQVFTWPGKDVDMGEDYADWSMSDLQTRVELVQDFDRLCDDIVNAYCDLCENHRITEEEILVPKTIKVLEPLA